MRRELLVFLLVGSLTVLIDFGTYRSLTEGGVGVDVAKGVSFLVGTTFAYFANRFWTFGGQAHTLGSAWRFGALYIVTLVLNIVANALSLKALAPFAFVVQAAFLIATGLSAIINFAGMKWVVFKAMPVAKSS